MNLPGGGSPYPRYFPGMPPRPPDLIPCVPPAPMVEVKGEYIEDCDDIKEESRSTPAPPPPPAPNCRTISSLSPGGVSRLGSYQSGTATFTVSGLSSDANGSTNVRCFCNATSDNLTFVSAVANSNGCSVNVKDKGSTRSFFTQAVTCSMSNSISGCTTQIFNGVRGISGNTYNAAPDKSTIVVP